MNKLLNKSNLIYNSLKSTVDSFYNLYDSIEDENEKQDLLRAIVLFSCSGIDAIVKQLVNDTLDYVIKHDEGAFNQFKMYTEKKLINRNDSTIDSKFLAELFTCDNPKDILINDLKHYLSGSSLQSPDELFKVGSFFNIETSKLENGKANHEELKKIFYIRNQITHEMDVDMSSKDFVRRNRVKEDIEKYSNHIIDLSKKFIDLVDEKLNDTSEVNEYDQLVSI